MQFEEKPEELLGLSRLSVDMGLCEETHRDNDLVGCSQSDGGPESLAALLSRLNNLMQAQDGLKRQPEERDSHKPSATGSTPPDHQRTPHAVDKSTTVAPGRRRFRASPRTPGPDALGARKPSEPKVVGPDSGILLSRSGRLCVAGGKAVETPDVVAVAGSMAPNSVFSDQVDVGMGVGHWCWDVVGRELMAAERCGRGGGYGRGQPERKLRGMRGVRI